MANATGQNFDNIVARWIYAVPHVLYNLLRYQRLPADVLQRIRRAQEGDGVNKRSIFDVVASCSNVALAFFASI